MSWRRIPGSRRLIVESSAGRRGRHVRTLTGASDWRREVLDRAGVAALTVLGANRLRPAEPIVWPAAGIEELADVLARELPGLRLFGIAIPRQRDRARLSAYGRMAGNPVIIKLGGDNAQIDREGHVLELLANDPLPIIETPVPLAMGTCQIGTQSAGYLATTAIALGRQRPAIDEPLRTFEADLAERLAALPRTGAATDDVPIHGDLTPWNLRRTERGLALFDWESAGWGTPGADIAQYRAACDEVRRPWSRQRPDSVIGASR